MSLWYTSEAVSKLPLRERIAFNIEGSSASDAIQRIVEAEGSGLRQVWMTAGGARGADPLTVYAGAATKTSKIRLVSRPSSLFEILPSTLKAML